MAYLIVGVLLWCLLHPIRSVAPGARDRMIAAVGAGPYRGVFSLLVLTAVVLMVVGWQNTTPAAVYSPPLWGRPLASPLMLLAFVLFAASGVPTNLKRLIRHPQLTGLLVWSFAHLAANGTQRALVLFGGLGIWALVEMVAISRREGPWEKPDAVPLGAEIKTVIGGLIGFVVVFLAHPYLFGVSPLP